MPPINAVAKNLRAASKTHFRPDNFARGSSECEKPFDEEDLIARAEDLLATWIVRLFFPINSSVPPPIVRSAALDFLKLGNVSYETLFYGRNKPGYAIALYNGRADILLPSLAELGAPQRISDQGWDGSEVDIGVILPEKDGVPFIPDPKGRIYLKDGLTTDAAKRMCKSDVWQTFCTIVEEELGAIREVSNESSASEQRAHRPGEFLSLPVEEDLRRRLRTRRPRAQKKSAVMPHFR